MCLYYQVLIKGSVVILSSIPLIVLMALDFHGRLYQQLASVHVSVPVKSEKVLLRLIHYHLGLTSCLFFQLS